MSRVLDVGECHCNCHRSSDMPARSRARHVVACCDGKCKYCRKYIAWGQLEKHLEIHEAVQRGLEQAKNGEFSDDAPEIG